MREGADQESIGALFARLVEDGRALAQAELALFRTDFYRRLSRARIAILLCLIGAIMGQAAAVTFLVTLSFVLQPWIGRLGGAAVSVLFGIGLAFLLIKIGIGQLTSVVDDSADEDETRNRPAAAGSMDFLFDRVRRRSQTARTQLIDTLGEAQARLHPQALIADLVEEITDHGQQLAHRAVDAARRRPFRLGAMLMMAILLIVRPPVGRIATGVARATRRGTRSLTAKGTRRSKARPFPKETAPAEEENPS